DAGGDGSSAGDPGKGSVVFFTSSRRHTNSYGDWSSDVCASDLTYSFSGLAAGSYHVSYVVTSGWANTGTRPQDVTLTAGQNATGDRKSVVQGKSAIAGTGYNDAGGDGCWAGDPGKASVAVDIDA